MKKGPWNMLIWLLITQLLVAFVGRSIGPLAPFIEKSFDLTKAEVGLLPAALFVGQSLVCIVAGWYADVIGTRKMMLILSTILSLGYLFASLASWYYFTLFFIFIGGLGYGAMHPTSTRGIIHWFPPKLAGTAMGIKQTGVTGGSAMAAFLLIPLALTIGWRGAVGVSIGLLVVVGVLAFIFYRDPPHKPSSLQAEPMVFWKTIKQLLHNKPLMAVSIAAMGLTGAQLSLSTYVVLFASQSLHYSLILAGSFLAIYEIGGCVGRISWGIVSDRIFAGRRSPVLMIVSVFTAIGSSILALLPGGTSEWVFAVIIFAMGFCIAGFNGIWMNYASEAVPSRISGLGSGFSTSIGSWGVVFGPPIFGWLVDWSGTFSTAWFFISIEMAAVIGCLWWADQKMKEVRQQGLGEGA